MCDKESIGGNLIVTNSHSRKARRLSETVVSWGRLEHGDWKRGTGSERVEERLRSAINLRRVKDAMWKARETRAEGERNVNTRVLVH